MSGSYSEVRSPMARTSVQLGESRVAAWAKQVESLDMKEIEFHATQTKVLREQVTALVADLTSLRADLQCLNKRQGDTENALGYNESLPGKDVFSRMRALEQIGDAHLGMIEEINKKNVRFTGLHEEHAKHICELKATDLKLFEGLADQHKAHASFVDSAQQDLQTLAASLEKTNKAVDTAKQEAMDLVPPVSKHLANVESNMAANFDKQWRELQELKTLATENMSSIAGNRKDMEDYRVLTDERVHCWEKVVTDGFEKNHAEVACLKQVSDNTIREVTGIQSKLRTMDQKDQLLEQKMVELFEKQVADLNSVKDSMAKHAAVQSGIHNDVEALKPLHVRSSSMIEHLQRLDEWFGDLSERHSKQLKDLTMAQDRQAEKQAKDMQVIKASHVELQQRLDALGEELKEAASWTTSEFALVKEVQQKHSNEHAEVVSEQKKHSQLLEERRLHEKNTDDVVARQASELAGLTSTFEKHCEEVKADKTAANDRMKAIEKHANDSNNNQLNRVQLLSASFDKHVHEHALFQAESEQVWRVVQRMDKLTTQHSKELDDVRANHSACEASVQQLSHAQQEMRTGQERHDKELNAIKTSLTKHADVMATNHKDALLLNDAQAMMKDQISGLTVSVKETADQQERDVTDLRNHNGLVTKEIHAIKETATKMHCEISSQRSGQTVLGDRLQTLENRLRSCFTGAAAHDTSGLL